MNINEVSAFSGSITIPGTITIGPGTADIGFVGLLAGTNDIGSVVLATGTNTIGTVDLGNNAPDNTGTLSINTGTINTTGTIALGAGQQSVVVQVSTIAAGATLTAKQLLFDNTLPQAQIVPLVQTLGTALPLLLANGNVTSIGKYEFTSVAGAAALIFETTGTAAGTAQIQYDATTASPVDAGANYALRMLGAALEIPSQTIEAVNALSVTGFGSAGTADTNVITVQGIAGGVAVPVSGSFTLTPSGTQTVAGTVELGAGTAVIGHAIVDSGTLVVSSGTVTLSGTSAISGAVTVTSGSIAISNTPTVVAGGGTIALLQAGTIVNNGGSVAVNGGTLALLQSGTLALLQAGSVAVTNTPTVVATGTVTVAGTVENGAGTAIIGKVGIDQTTAVTTNGVIIAPSSASAAGITVVSSASLESTHVLKASAGNLYYVAATNGTATPGFLVVTNGTSAATSGAIVPLHVRPLPPNGSAVIALSPGPASVFSTGISVILTSASTPFTATTGTLTGFIEGLVQ